MSYSISKSDMIGYRPEDLSGFSCYIYEWIDNLNFCLPVRDVVGKWESYDKEARKKFSIHGWNGEGDIELMWIPPFSLGGILADGVDSFLEMVGDSWKNGLVLWHVKQIDDGLSFVLSPVKLKLPDIGIE
ncbi:hypothetical protein GR157_32500 [Burkholderia sp. 4701]|nr:hypothetical protein [Burkholderia sp. 4701]MXN86697.1 hypothetical protein [Burkholderia sp. 4812]